MAATTGLTRRELYGVVWQQPVSRVASRYGLSDVGLAKICKRYDIPRPPRGYWAKLQNGQKPRRTPLPHPDRNEHISLEGHGGVAAACLQIGSEARERMDAEKQDDMRVKVPESLRGCHQLVSQANQVLQAALTDSNQIIIRPKDTLLDVATSASQLRRALLIMDALLKAFEERGYEVEAGPAVKLYGLSVGFGISEGVETQREEPKEHNLEGPYSFGHSRFDVKRVPSGRLTLSIKKSSHWAGESQHSWRDTERTQLEDRLNSFVAGVIRFAACLRASRDEERRKAESRRQEELRRQEEARRQAERRQRYKTELARVEELLSQAKNYRIAREVREFIAAVRDFHTADGPIKADSEVGRWLEWSTAQADRLDPLSPSPPSILDEDPAKPADPPDGTQRR